MGDYGCDYVTSATLSIDEMKTKVSNLEKVVYGDKNDIFQSSYKQGLLDFFDIEKKIVVTISISKEQLSLIDNDNGKGSKPANYKGNQDTYRMCNVDITYEDLVFHLEEVGIRMKGNTSRGQIINGDTINLRHYKLCFDETFDDEADYGSNVKVWENDDARKDRKKRTFMGLEKLNLRYNKNRESTYLREYYAYEMYRDLGLLSARSNLMNINMNVDGEIYNCGIYLGVEQIDDEFLERNLIASEIEGNLYKASWKQGKANLNDSSSHLMGVSTLSHEYTYDLKTNKKTVDHSALKSFINTCNSTSVSNMDTFIKNYTYSDTFTSYLAVGYFLGDPDDFRGNGNNYYIYFTSDNKMILIPNDNDRVMGSMGEGDAAGTDFGTNYAPNANKTGYGEVDHEILKKTIVNGNQAVIDDYNTQLEMVANSKWVKLETYKNYFDIVSKNYAQEVKLSSNISGSTTSFNMTEAHNNMSVETYLNKKMDTYNNYLGNKPTVNPDTNPPVDPGTNPPASNTDKIYIFGSMNEWGMDEAYIMSAENGIYTYTGDFQVNEEVKVRNLTVDTWKGFEVFNSTSSFITNSGSNLKFNETGNYTITYDLGQDSITITKN